MGQYDDNEDFHTFEYLWEEVDGPLRFEGPATPVVSRPARFKFSIKIIDPDGRTEVVENFIRLRACVPES